VCKASFKVLGFDSFWNADSLQRKDAEREKVAPEAFKRGSVVTTGGVHEKNGTCGHHSVP